MTGGCSQGGRARSASGRPCLSVLLSVMKRTSTPTAGGYSCYYIVPCLSLCVATRATVVAASAAYSLRALRVRVRVAVRVRELLRLRLRVRLRVRDRDSLGVPLGERDAEGVALALGDVSGAPAKNTPRNCVPAAALRRRTALVTPAATPAVS